MQLVVEECCNSLIGWIKVSVITAFWSAYVLQKSFRALSFESRSRKINKHRFSPSRQKFLNICMRLTRNIYRDRLMMLAMAFSTTGRDSIPDSQRRSYESSMETPRQQCQEVRLAE